MTANLGRVPTILVVQPFYADLTHASVNACFLKAMVLGRPDARIVFAAHPGHYAAVLAVVPELANMMDHRPIEVMPQGGIRYERFQYHRRLLMQHADATDASSVVCLAIVPETLFACVSFRLSRPAIPVLAILHGDLSSAIGWRSKDPRRRLFDHRAAIRAAAMAGVRFVVLEHYIKRTAVQLGLIRDAQCDVWPLPVLDAEFVDACPALSPDRLRLGFLGFAKRQKGFDIFLDLVATADRHQADWIDFVLIGGIAEARYEPLPSRVSVVPGVDERANFIAGVRAVDYATLFLDDHTYRLTSSGTVVDALAALRPVIGLQTLATREMFDGQPVGYLCDTMDALRTLITNRAALFDAARYRTFQDGLLALRRGRRATELAHLMAGTIRLRKGP